MCTCVCVRVFARQGHRTISHSYVSPGDWTQVWRLTLRAITGSGMSYKFKIWNLWAPCFSQSWVLVLSTYTLLTTHRKHADPPTHTHTCAHMCMHIHTHVHTQACTNTHMHARTHIHAYTYTHARTCTQLLLLPQSVIIQLPWFLLHLSGPVHNHPLLNEC